MSLNNTHTHQALELDNSLESHKLKLDRLEAACTIYSHRLPDVQTYPDSNAIQKVGCALKYIKSKEPCGFSLADITLVDPTLNISTIRGTVRRLLEAGAIEIAYKGEKGRGSTTIYRFI